MSPATTMLPVEILRMIFELAAESDIRDRFNTCRTLSLVSSVVRDWIQPVLYKTVNISLELEWDAFRRTVLAHPGKLPVVNLSVLVRPPPPGEEFAEVVAALPKLQSAHVALFLVPHLAQSSIRRLYVSKHGPPPASLPPDLRLPSVTRLYFEPYYSGLYPLTVRKALPTIFPNLTHFGMTYVVSTDAVARDLVDLARRVLALRAMYRVYIRVLGQTQESAEKDADALGETCRTLGDARVWIGHGTTAEWNCPKCTERVNYSWSMWLPDALGSLDMWAQGASVWP